MKIKIERRLRNIAFYSSESVFRMLDSATFIEVPAKTDCNLWVEKRINALAILAYENE